MLLVLAVTSCTVVVKQMPGEHPAYLHALADLRAARAFLNKLTDSEAVDQRETDAIASINKAIGEIKKAAIDDGLDVKEKVSIDAALNKQGRFQKAIELLVSARRDINREEDNGFANGLKKRAIDHINNAINIAAGHFRTLYPGIKINIEL